MQNLNPDTITRFIRLIKAPGSLVEVRAFLVGHQRGVYAGWFTPESAGLIPAKLSGIGETEGVFITPQKLCGLANQTPEGYFGRPNRRGKDVPKREPLTTDGDISTRAYALIDCDPVRAAGHEKDSATDGEKQAAFRLATTTRDYLRAWLPAPLVVDSGNGYHLYYRLPEPLPGGPITDDSTDPLARLLRSLAGRFDTPEARIDTVIFNPARLMKLPGTVARKGVATSERPHRMADILEVPNDWLPVG